MDCSGVCVCLRVITSYTLLHFFDYFVFYRFFCKHHPCWKRCWRKFFILPSPPSEIGRCCDLRVLLFKYRAKKRCFRNWFCSFYQFLSKEAPKTSDTSRFYRYFLSGEIQYLLWKSSPELRCLLWLASILPRDSMQLLIGRLPQNPSRATEYSES